MISQTTTAQSLTDKQNMKVPLIEKSSQQTLHIIFMTMSQPWNTFHVNSEVSNQMEMQSQILKTLAKSKHYFQNCKKNH